jgi:hypothetical protein
MPKTKVNKTRELKGEKEYQQKKAGFKEGGRTSQKIK